MPKPTDEGCGTCRYYVFVLEHSQFCQRYPPQAFGSSQTWPSVKDTDWCGEYAKDPAMQHRGKK